eukprot:g1176.t1
MGHVAPEFFVLHNFISYPTRDSVETEDGESISEDDDEDEDDDKRVTKSTAKGEYKLTDSHLARLNCKLVKNPHYRSAAPMRLYLLREVKRISKNIRIERAKLARAKLHAAIEKRVNQLRKRDIDPFAITCGDLRDEIFGDFLDDAEKVTSKITDVTKKFRAHRMINIMPKMFHRRTDIRQLFFGVKMRNRNPAAHVKCIIDKARRRTALLGIVLTPGTPIVDTLSTFVQMNDLRSFECVAVNVSSLKDGVDKMILAKERAWGTALERVEAVLNKARTMGIDSSSLRRAKRRMESAPGHALLGVEATEARLTEIERSTRPKRKALLVAALGEYGVRLRSDSGFCKSFIAGSSLASAQEVAATMRITSFLFSYGHEVWSEFSDSCERDMSNLLLTDQVACWHDACTEVMGDYEDECEDARTGRCIECAVSRILYRMLSLEKTEEVWVR